MILANKIYGNTNGYSRCQWAGTYPSKYVQSVSGTCWRIFIEHNIYWILNNFWTHWRLISLWCRNQLFDLGLKINWMVSIWWEYWRFKWINEMFCFFYIIYCTLSRLPQPTFTCSKWTIETLEKDMQYVTTSIKTPELRHWRRSDVFIVNFLTFFLCFHCSLWTSKCCLRLIPYIDPSKLISIAN